MIVVPIYTSYYYKPQFSLRLPELSLSKPSLIKAKRLYSKLKDYEYIHIFIHLYEIADILPQIKLIYSDIKPENLVDYSVTRSLVLFDFSKSWVSINNSALVSIYLRGSQEHSRSTGVQS